jgi:hypothetical protein
MNQALYAHMNNKRKKNLKPPKASNFVLWGALSGM